MESKSQGPCRCLDSSDSCQIDNSDEAALFADAIRLLTASDDLALAAEVAAVFCGVSQQPPPPLLAALASLAARPDALRAWAATWGWGRRWRGGV